MLNYSCQECSSIRITSLLLKVSDIMFLGQPHNYSCNFAVVLLVSHNFSACRNRPFLQFMSFDSSSQSSLLHRHCYTLGIHWVVCLCSSGFVFFNLRPFQTRWSFAELSEAHLLPRSCTTEPTLQALSLCLFLSNSHSLFTFAFLHCDFRQNNITPSPLRRLHCQAFLFKVVVKQKVSVYKSH